MGKNSVGFFPLVLLLGACSSGGGTTSFDGEIAPPPAHPALSGADAGPGDVAGELVHDAGAAGDVAGEVARPMDAAPDNGYGTVWPQCPNIFPTFCPGDGGMAAGQSFGFCFTCVRQDNGAPVVGCANGSPGPSGGICVASCAQCR